jgi:hypothetical protein
LSQAPIFPGIFDFFIDFRIAAPPIRNAILKEVRLCAVVAEQLMSQENRLDLL